MKRMFFGVFAIGLLLVFCMVHSSAASNDYVSTSGDIQSPNGNSSTLIGYLVDQIDAQQDGGFDGSDLTRHPDIHTLHGPKMSKSIVPGFGVYVKDANDTYVSYEW